MPVQCINFSKKHLDFFSDKPYNISGFIRKLLEDSPEYQEWNKQYGENG